MFHTTLWMLVSWVLQRVCTAISPEMADSNILDQHMSMCGTTAPQKHPPQERPGIILQSLLSNMPLHWHYIPSNPLYNNLYHVPPHLPSQPFSLPNFYFVSLTLHSVYRAAPEAHSKRGSGTPAGHARLQPQVWDWDRLANLTAEVVPVALTTHHK